MTRQEPLLRFTQALAVALGHRDLPTRLHSERVGNLAVRLGMTCGLCERELGFLEIAAGFHDIGKVGVPDAILRKPGRLDAAERSVIELHPEIGAEILQALDVDGAHDVATAVRHHHEHFDGNGYPNRMRGTDIPLLSRIIGIVDSYDAIAERRSYHDARRHDEVIEVLLGESGRKHDPELIRRFCGLFESPIPGPG